jgi:hypothetical protein
VVLETERGLVTLNALNSLFGISFVVTCVVVVVVVGCVVVVALNSLFGISFVVTVRRGPPGAQGSGALNSLFGISFVVTAAEALAWIHGALKGLSQFPFWDFFCCNRGPLY